MINIEHKKTWLCEYKRANDIVCISVLGVPIYRRVGKACVAKLLGVVFYKRLGFQSVLFGVPFNFKDLRWQHCQVNS